MKNILLTFYIIILASCSSNKSELNYEWYYASNNSWYEMTRAKIIEQSKLKANKYSDVNIDGIKFLVRKYFNENHEFRREYIDKSEKIRGVILFSRNSDFELRNEVFENGELSFEGIVYKGEFYGPSRWWYPNGKLKEIRNRYKGKSIGLWEKYDENQNLIEATDDGKAIPIDSLPLL